MDVCVINELSLNDSNRCEKINEILKCLIFSNERIQKIAEVFESEMELALNERQSSLQMENTYIPELPDGTENGIYLALDLGGTNFRILLIEMEMGKITNEIVQHYHIDDDLRIGDGDNLFLYLAKCVKNFQIDNQLDMIKDIPLGFTFSFPMKHQSLQSGYLLTWTKTFNCPSLIGKCVVRKLHESLIKCNCNNVNVLAILNDTTGTLIQGANLDKNCRIGIVLGTGTNGCYMELAERVKHWEIKHDNIKNVIIDIEWGAFGDNGVLDFLKTEFDRNVDNGSLLKNSFTYEKYISGLYLGELFRCILRKLIDEQLLFAKSKKNHLFPKSWEFGSDNVSKIEQDTVDGIDERLMEIFNKIGYKYNLDYDQSDITIIRYVSGLISKRAAQLLAINISVLLKRMPENNITIAIDGSVYKHHPRLRVWMEKFTQELTPNKISKFMLAEDGSGKGAALVAAIAKKLQERK